MQRDDVGKTLQEVLALREEVIKLADQVKSVKDRNSFKQIANFCTPAGRNPRSSHLESSYQNLTSLKIQVEKKKALEEQEAALYSPPQEESTFFGRLSKSIAFGMKKSKKGAEEELNEVTSFHQNEPTVLGR